MACLNSEKIIAHAEGELNAIEASRVRDHLLVCPGCRLAADRLRIMNQALSRPRFSEPPASVIPQVMQRLFPFLPRYTSIVAAIAASLIFLITWIYVYFDFASSSLIQALRLTADGSTGWLLNIIKAVSAVYNASQAAFKAGNALLRMLLPAPLATTVIAASLLALSALLVFLLNGRWRKKTGAERS